MDGFIGEVKYFAGTYAPSGWLFCQGQQLPIVQYTPLYSLIGTQFGGNGTTNFNLPDFRGRMAICAGQGTNLTLHKAGETGGSQQIQLLMQNLPLHNHNVNCDTTSGSRALQATPLNNLFATNGAYGTDETNVPLMKTDMLNNEGQSGAHENMLPWLCLNYIICVYGYYPIRP
jgi:microcystin-dependent protein